MLTSTGIVQYIAITVGRDNFMGLEKYFQLEGLAYRLVPYISNSTDGQTGTINTEIMYDNLINKFNWGGLNVLTYILTRPIQEWL